MWDVELSWTAYPYPYLPPLERGCARSPSTLRKQLSLARFHSTGDDVDREGYRYTTITDTLTDDFVIKSLIYDCISLAKFNQKSCLGHPLFPKESLLEYESVGIFGGKIISGKLTSNRALTICKYRIFFFFLQKEIVYILYVNKKKFLRTSFFRDERKDLVWN